MPVRKRLYHLLKRPLANLLNQLLITALTSDSGKAIVKIYSSPGIATSLDRHRAVKSILPLKPFFVDLFESFEMILHALILW
jgi:hypothetical protein